MISDDISHRHLNGTIVVPQSHVSTNYTHRPIHLLRFFVPFFSVLKGGTHRVKRLLLSLQNKVSIPVEVLIPVCVCVCVSVISTKKVFN